MDFWGLVLIVIVGALAASLVELGSWIHRVKEDRLPRSQHIKRLALGASLAYVVGGGLTVLLVAIAFDGLSKPLALTIGAGWDVFMRTLVRYAPEIPCRLLFGLKNCSDKDDNDD